MDFYCVQYQAKTEIRDPVGVTMKNGSAATHGIGVDCGAKKFRIDAPSPTRRPRLIQPTPLGAGNPESNIDPGPMVGGQVTTADHRHPSARGTAGLRR